MITYKFQRISAHASRYTCGSPFNTGAIVQSLPPALEEIDRLPHFISRQLESHLSLRTELEVEDRVFGLGQMLSALNRRGKRFRLFAKDDPSHTPDKSSLYGSHPFFIIQGPKTYGVFIDYPGEIICDVGFGNKDVLEILIASPNFDIYIFEHWDIKLIVREFLQLTGAPYLPPRWAFGYQQCRYSYPDAESVRNVAESCSQHDIPCDAIYLDIDYMQDYKIFSVNEERFPDLPGLTAEMNAQGIKLIPIIDPGVKIEPGYATYDSGLAGQHFCVDAENKPFTAAVWPGLVHLPDFLNARCRKWWAELYRPFVDIGIEHFWNDMSEPAIFYTPQSLEMLRESVKKIEHTDDLGTEAPEFIGSLSRFWQNESDLKQFFHILDDGTKVCHYDVHNLYGFYMAQATAEGLRTLKPDQRYFLVARSSYIGMHRFAVIWTGDNSSWWEHMLTQIRMVMSLNLAGFFFCGGDIGGFGGDASAELCVRWTQLGCVTPLFRNHSTKGSRAQEPWAFDDESLKIMRHFIRLRYALLPYIYSEFIQAISNSTPFISPLWLNFGDSLVKDIEDQFMFGSSIMAAPVHVQAARSRFVYLPECRWLLWNVRRWDERDMKIMPPGSHLIEADLNQMPLFIKENSLIALVEPNGNTSARAPSALYVIGFVSSEAELSLWADDGRSWGYQSGQISTLRLKVGQINNSFEYSALPSPNSACPIPYEKIIFEIYDTSGVLHTQELTIQIPT